MLSIGELSRKTGVKSPTIRYYEQVGMIEAAERSAGNQRRYTNRELERLTFIKHARDLGFSIESIRELLDLSSHPERPCADADRIAKQNLVSVRERIAKLQKLETELQRISKGCHTNSIENCYVIEALSNHTLCDNSH